MKELILNTDFLSIKQRIKLIRFIDAHDLTPEQLNDNEYINTLIENFKIKKICNQKITNQFKYNN